MPVTPFDGGPVSVDERYESASSTSDLTVFGGMIPPDARTPQGDVILAAGMNESRLGMALLRLHSEWAGSAKPRKVSPQAVQRIAESIRQADAKERQSASVRKAPYTQPKPAQERAEREAAHWHTNELRILANRLKGRALVIEQLMLWAQIKGVPADTVSAALLHWLSPACVTCSGLGWIHRTNLPSKPCTCAHGENWTTPGEDYVIGHIAACVGTARRSLRLRLRR